MELDCGDTIWSLGLHEGVGQPLRHKSLACPWWALQHQVFCS